MSTEASGLPENRFTASVSGRVGITREHAVRDAEGHNASLLPSERQCVVYEAIPVAEADLLRAYVAAVQSARKVSTGAPAGGRAEWEQWYDERGQAWSAVDDTYDALLAVAPHWGGE